MVFSSLFFIYCFMPLFFLVYFNKKDRQYRNIILLVFSLLFYSWGEPVYIFLMIFSILVNYKLALLLEKKKKFLSSKNIRFSIKKTLKKKLKIILNFGLIFNILIVVIFKYLDFLIMNINVLFNTNIKFVNLPLPIGISFFTFQIISYIVDVYRGEVEAQKNVFYLGAYIAAFPQLVAGPIVKYETVSNELENRKETRDMFANGIRRFIIGLSKKVIIANNVAQVIDTLEAYSNIQYKSIGAIIIAISYTLQIYFDFSGYSDMAIGLGKMLGFKYNENFNYPYISKSITEFWRRWHISLSSFFRDYVYIPLGGNRVSNLEIL